MTQLTRDQVRQVADICQRDMGVDLYAIDEHTGLRTWDLMVNPRDVTDWHIRPSQAMQDWQDQQCGGCDNGECCEMDSCPACECDDA